MELRLEEDSFDFDQACVWPIRIGGEPRVYEIAGPADWARLVDAYPLEVTDSRRGDWYDTTGEYADWFIPDCPPSTTTRWTSPSTAISPRPANRSH